MPGITGASAPATSVRRGPREPREVAAPRVYPQLAGCILWLPSKTELGIDSTSDIEEDRCNHPVVILSPQVDDGKVVYLMVTSLKGTDLEHRFIHDPSLRLEHIPIRPNRPHPDNGMLLSLEDVTLELRKKSYVKTKTQYCIKLTLLRAYDRRGPDYVLSRKSYQELTEYARFTPPTPHPVSSTVSSAGRIRQYGQPIPITRERSGSYSEYVSALRGLEGGAGSPPRVTYSPTAPMSATQYPRITERRWELAQPRERERLLPVASHGYSTHSHLHSHSNIPGSYPAGGHPAYAYNAAVRSRYQGPEPPEPFDWTTLWKMLFWIAATVLVGYGLWCGASWLVDVARSTSNAIKIGIEEMGTKIGDKMAGLWSRLGNLVRPYD
ncbi:hypothetical protein GGR54DRAFT_395163 [Hypoxylon sp. NC1633]|nr:hypothetical protein GGR54DRAFT_395163 [Hypoxylon sp. NC1633]